MTETYCMCERGRKREKCHHPAALLYRWREELMVLTGGQERAIQRHDEAVSHAEADQLVQALGAWSEKQ